MRREHKPPYTKKVGGFRRVSSLENRGCDFYDDDDRKNVIMMSLSEMGFYFSPTGLKHWDDEDLCVCLLGEGEWVVRYGERVKVLDLYKHRDCYELVRELVLGIRDHYEGS